MNSTNFTYKDDPFRFQDMAALLATSRAEAFLSAFEWPAKGREREAEHALAGLFDARLDTLHDRPITRSDVEAALGRTGIGADAAAVVEWIADLPDDGGARGLGCVFYWAGVFMEPQPAADRDAPPAVASDKWRSLRAAGEDRPQDAPDPDPLAPMAARYRRETDHLRSLRAEIAEWQQGPFSDLDLALAKTFDWAVSDGVMWARWTSVIRYSLARSLWANFAPAFTAPEKDALVEWKSSHAAEARAAMPADPTFPELADVLIPGPPCHPDEMLRPDA